MSDVFYGLEGSQTEFVYGDGLSGLENVRVLASQQQQFGDLGWVDTLVKGVLGAAKGVVNAFTGGGSKKKKQPTQQIVYDAKGIPNMIVTDPATGMTRMIPMVQDQGGDWQVPAAIAAGGVGLLLLVLLLTRKKT